MRSGVLFVFILISFCSLAQFAIIEDKDGYVNIRKQADAKSEVIERFTTEDIFWCLWPEGEWYQLDTKKGPGYIHKSRVKFISSFATLLKLKGQPNEVVFKNNDIIVSISTKAFKEGENKIEFKARGDMKDVIKINGKEPWGNFGTMPKEEYQAVKYSFGNKAYVLPKDEVANLFNPDLKRTHVYFNEVNNTIYITADNSDGAGAYSVVWIIKGEKYQKRELAIGF